MKGRYFVCTTCIYLYTEKGSLLGLLIFSRGASLSGLLRSPTQCQPINKAQHSRLSPEIDTTFSERIDAVKCFNILSTISQL